MHEFRQYVRVPWTKVVVAEKKKIIQELHRSSDLQGLVLDSMWWVEGRNIGNKACVRAVVLITGWYLLFS